jgi:CheY-like chemotaxis protein
MGALPPGGGRLDGCHRTVILYKTKIVMSPSGKPVILVVDDDCDVRDALAALLEDAGYQPVCKQDGRAALLYLRKQTPPAAVLLDLFMPQMNGWEFMQKLKAKPKLKALPVIMVTGNQPHWGYPVPDSMVVRKPINPERLLELLRGIIGLPAQVA